MSSFHVRLNDDHVPHRIWWLADERHVDGLHLAELPHSWRVTRQKLEPLILKFLLPNCFLFRRAEREISLTSRLPPFLLIDIRLVFDRVHES